MNRDFLLHRVETSIRYMAHAPRVPSIRYILVAAALAAAWFFLSGNRRWIVGGAVLVVYPAVAFTGLAAAAAGFAVHGVAKTMQLRTKDEDES